MKSLKTRSTRTTIQDDHKVVSSLEERLDEEIVQEVSESVNHKDSLD